MRGEAGYLCGGRVIYNPRTFQKFGMLRGIIAWCLILGVIQKIKFMGVPVADQDRALKFYTEKLGFELVGDVPFEEGKRWITVGIPGAETKITLFTPEGQEDRVGTFANMAYHSADVQATYEELKGKGVEFTMPPTPQPWGVMAIFKDSEGNSFCISTEHKTMPTKDRHA